MVSAIIWYFYDLEFLNKTTSNAYPFMERRFSRSKTFKQQAYKLKSSLFKNKLIPAVKLELNMYQREITLKLEIKRLVMHIHSLKDDWKIRKG